MGTPKQLRRFSVCEMHGMLSLAKETAMDFRSLDARVKALDYLRVSLLPMVEWLDKPIKECFPGSESKTSNASTKRAMPFFKGFRAFSPVALARKGDWVTLTPVGIGVVSVTSEWLALVISQSRYDILGAIPWGHKRGSMVTAESVGMNEVVEHCAFLKYLTLGMGELDEILKERENRLHTMRYNFSFLESFISGIDPFEYGAPEPSLPGYALFDRHSRGTSRCSGTYLVPGPVEKEVEDRNKRRTPRDDCEYYVFEDGNRRFGKLEDFLSSVKHSIENVTDGGVFRRAPLSDEEKKVITDFAKGIGNSFV